jgi:hypothetical protein
LTNDVKPYLQFPVGSSASDTMLQLIIDMSCTWVQNYLGRPIAETEFFRRFSGFSGYTGAYIGLPYSPVTKVISVVEYWGSSGPHTLTEQTPANQGGQDVYQVDWLRGTIIRTFTGLVQRPWFVGSRNIEITWKAGYNPVPADIKVATLKLIKHWWTHEQQASRTAPMPAGGGHDEMPMTGMFAGIPPETERLLSPYVQMGIG